MFKSPTPHDLIMQRFENLELQLAEANLSLVELRKAELQSNANLSSLMGEVAKVSCTVTAVVGWELTYYSARGWKQ